MIFSTMSLLLGYLYPGYKTYKVIKSGKNEDQVHCLMYWLVFSAFAVIESILDLFIFWVPFYHEAKLIFLVWLWHSGTQGAVFLYESYVGPYLDENESKIDAALSQSKDAFGQIAFTYGKRGAVWIKDRSVELFFKGQQFMMEQALENEKRNQQNASTHPTLDQHAQQHAASHHHTHHKSSLRERDTGSKGVEI
eukprot:TRINITY_DN7651_c0_g1::TRINITY_DN7651_c0_g1_i1::g.18564::m.18564 TRINITY_DN7651_c0_g1::TRINITY_DN7651_c0_g1_i1::g.18564  ORF type:complete len:194 (+),score=40.37,sp/Q4QQW1/REEP4_RAT/40.50/3e-27,TB2_DP1_HVA22/PF03134.14/4.2e-27,TraF/PF13728.1/4.1e+02,TraF/PF13728.1/0.032,DUF2052/PF09747.4/0.049 TRINITY_DN7651_c0_g1_i1:106-687(+)